MLENDITIQNFLNTFPQDVTEEGKKLQAEGNVTQIFGDDAFIQGRVKIGKNTFRIVITKKDYRWHGVSSSEDASLCPGIVALMLERMKRDASLPHSPNEINGVPLKQKVEKLLERELNQREKEYLIKIENRYRRYEIEEKIYDYDIVRLQPNWEVKSYDPLELWPTPPKDIIEFWNFLAYLFYNKNMAFPKFLNCITDISSIEDIFRSWEEEKELSKWNKAINNFSSKIQKQQDITLQARLIVNSLNVRLQICYQSPKDKNSQTPPTKEEKNIKVFSDEANSITFSSNFRYISNFSEVELINNLFLNNEIAFDKDSEHLWQCIFPKLEFSKKPYIRLDNLANAKLLNRIFSQDNLTDLVLTLDEVPFKQADFKLVWQCDYSSNDKDYGYKLKLGTDSDREIYHTLVWLPGKQNIYLSDNIKIFGPPAWQKSPEILPEFSIPTQAIENNNGINFLEKISCPLPENLVKRVVRSKMLVTIACQLKDDVPGFESEQLFVRVTATDESNQFQESFQNNQWVVEKSPELNLKGNTKDDKIYHLDRTDCYRIPTLLNDLNLTYSDKYQAYKTRVIKAFAEKFIEWRKKITPDINLELGDKLTSLFAEPLKTKLKLSIEETENDWFNISLTLDIKDYKLTEAEIKKHLMAHGNFIRGKNGKWVRLSIDMNDQYKEALRNLCIDPYSYHNQQHRLHVLQLYMPSASGLFEAKTWEKIKNRAQELKIKSEVSVPKDLNGELRPYQMEGFRFLSYLSENNFGGILADDMGLGKTIQSITWLLWLLKKKDSVGKKCLVICPKTVLDVWASEISKFAPEVSYKVVRKKEEFNSDLINSKISIIILNYAQLRILVDKLVDYKWLAIVLDEGQQIKNPDSKSSKAANQLKAENRLVLSGTPVENRPLDIWSLMSFSMPGTLGNRNFFMRNFDRRKNPNANFNISSRLRPFILRRTKSQVQEDLPPKTEEEILCTFSNEEKEIYQSYLSQIQKDIKKIKNQDEIYKSNFIVIQGMLRLRQICCNPVLIDQKYSNIASSKLKALYYHLSQLQEEGHKVLVFSQFVKMLDIIKDKLEEDKSPYFYLTGKTKNRSDVVTNFQESKDPSVFLLSLKAGGSGLNLTAASYVILYDPWWNPAVEAQAIDRTHRIGQVNPVNAYRLIVRDTIEEKIRKLQKKKALMSSEILGYESFAKNLTIEDLRYLFSLSDDDETQEEQNDDQK